MPPGGYSSGGRSGSAFNSSPATNVARGVSHNVGKLRGGSLSAANKNPGIGRVTNLVLPADRGLRTVSISRPAAGRPANVRSLPLRLR